MAWYGCSSTYRETTTIVQYYTIDYVCSPVTSGGGLPYNPCGFVTDRYIWALARAQTPSCDRFYPCYHLLFTACKNIHPFKSYAHICEHLPGPYYRDCHVDYLPMTYDLPTYLIAK